MELTANTRTITGKKVRFLRREGITPAHVFGHGIEPIPVQCETGELKKVLAQAGTTGIIKLKVDKARKMRNVMVREVQKEPRTGELLHVDLYQIRMEEKLKVDVPLIIIGEPPALKHKENYLAQELDTISIECLPDAIPNHVEVDVSGLEEAEQAIHVQDLELSEDVTVLNHDEQLIVKISVRHIEREISEEEGEGAEEGEPVAEETPEEASSGE
ncbi:MAG: 50S ribosomal protein L25 [Dehalococcoidales bacterium]|nr:50S ribosomal protein L25 [Dehalococcoidales bacterium]